MWSYFKDNKIIQKKWNIYIKAPEREKFSLSYNRLGWLLFQYKNQQVTWLACIRISFWINDKVCTCKCETEIFQQSIKQIFTIENIWSQNISIFLEHTSQRCQLGFPSSKLTNIVMVHISMTRKDHANT